MEERLRRGGRKPLRKKLVVLYFMFIVLFGLSVFSLWQFILPMIQETTNTEEPYVFTELQEIVEISESDFKIQYDGETLFAQNSDFVGWLFIPDTTISFPVVQGSDNSFYLNHGFDKTYSFYGCPFFDTRSPVGGDNAVIHGHNIGTNRTEMFSTLTFFQNPEYASQHKIAYFSLYPSSAEVQYELFAVVNFNLNNELTYLFSEFEDQNHRYEYVRFMMDNSLYVSEFVPTGEILILSTCNHRYGKESRLLLCFGEKTKISINNSNKNEIQE